MLAVPGLRSVCALVLVASTAQAQCGEFDRGFGSMGLTSSAGAPGTGLCSAVFDDGSGPALYVGGYFELAGGATARGIARWDGAHWSAVGGSLYAAGASVNALAVFDDGGGPALYAGGTFGLVGGVLASYIAKWNGSSWSALGSGLGGPVDSLCVFDDGSGPALYAGGNFAAAGGAPANRVARWNGSSWSALGSGLNNQVRALASYDDGSGPALYAGGLFTSAGGSPANYLARWNGSNWSPMGSGAGNAVNGLLVADLGAGAALYACGVFGGVDGVSAPKIACWDGVSWSGFGSGWDSAVQTIAVHDDGNGPALYAAGMFTLAPGTPANGIARWDGTHWSALGTGLPAGQPYALASFDAGQGAGAQLFVTGDITLAGGTTVAGLAVWDGNWHPESSPVGGPDATVQALAVHDDGSGPALFVGGQFSTVGSLASGRIARWDGTSWSALGAGIPAGTVYALASDNGAGGTKLYAAGSFTSAGGVPASCIACWDANHWTALGSGVSGIVRALAVFDDGSGRALYAAGMFTQAGGLPAARVARWNGTAWSALDTGFNDSVYALAVYDDGSGPSLYAAGKFTIASGATALAIARWDGAHWQPVGPGIDINLALGGAVYALAVHDDGSGSALYATGFLHGAGGVQMRNLVRWNGSVWSSVGPEPDNDGYALASYDDGTGDGPQLYLAGALTHVGTVAVQHGARWNGSSWSALGEGVTSAPFAFAACQHDPGQPADLYLGGMFTQTGWSASHYVARWKGCADIGRALCPGDGSVVACPCGNTGLAGSGCDNSQATGGARLAANGWASVAHDRVVLRSEHELPSSMSTFLQGTSLVAAVPFGDGLRCVGGNLKRLFVLPASGGVASAPALGAPSISSRSAALGDVIHAGSTRYYQVSYRDPNLAYCPPPQGNSWNASSALALVWLP